MGSLWTVLIAAPLAFILQTLAHELAHLLTAVHYGATSSTFKPWPHTYKGKFYFGRVQWRHPLGERIVGWPRAHIALAPYLLALIESGVFSLCWYETQAVVFAVFGAASFIDLIHGLIQPLWSTQCDVRTAVEAIRDNN